MNNVPPIMRNVMRVLGALAKRGLLRPEGSAEVNRHIVDGRPYWVADVRPSERATPEGNEKPQPDPNQSKGHG